MSEVSVHFCETEVVFAVDGEVAGRLLNSNCHPEGLAEFKRTNYDLQGSVGYQSFLRGTVAGLVLTFGPYGERRDPEDSTAKELQTIEPSDVGSVESVLLDPGPLPTDPASHVSFDIPSESASGELSPDVAEISQNPEEVSGEVARTEPAKSDPSPAAEAPAQP